MTEYRADPHRLRDAWERARRTLGVGLVVATLEGGVTGALAKLGVIEWTQAYWSGVWAAFSTAALAAAGSYVLRMWRTPSVPNQGGQR